MGTRLPKSHCHPVFSPPRTALTVCSRHLSLGPARATSHCSRECVPPPPPLPQQGHRATSLDVMVSVRLGISVTWRIIIHSPDTEREACY